MAAKYRLVALVKLRTRENKRAEIVLAKRLGELLAAKEKFKKLEEEKKAIQTKEKESRHKMDAEMNHGGRVQKGCFHVNFLRKLKEDAEAKTEEIVEQKEVILECQEKVVKARKDYIETVKQLRMMEKHKGLWKNKVAQEMLKKE